MSQEMIAYISKAARPLTADDVEQIAVDSAENNRKANITGLLLQIGGFYVQVLEGEAGALASLLKTIGRDDRHVDLCVVYKAPEQSKVFPQWRMGYFNIEKHYYTNHLDVAQLRRDTTDAFTLATLSRTSIIYLSTVYTRYILAEMQELGRRASTE